MQIADFGKKGQIKMQQTAFMLIALTLFFVLVGLFFLNYSLSGLKHAKANANADKASKLVSRIADSPELACGSAYGETSVSCIDFDKLMALKAHAKDYEDFWKVNNIEVLVVYPSGPIIPCISENYPNCNKVVIFNKSSSGFDQSNYVSLCRTDSSGNSLYNNCTLAKLMVKYSNE